VVVEFEEDGERSGRGGINRELRATWAGRVKYARHREAVGWKGVRVYGLACMAVAVMYIVCNVRAGWLQATRF
jgi:hypothetical protein